eukprot:1145837-Rhodomonas_salina.2
MYRPGVLQDAVCGTEVGGVRYSETRVLCEVLHGVRCRETRVCWAVCSTELGRGGARQRCPTASPPSISPWTLKLSPTSSRSRCRSPENTRGIPRNA